jgi:hypothetical protein
LGLTLAQMLIRMLTETLIRILIQMLTPTVVLTLAPA